MRGSTMVRLVAVCVDVEGVCDWSTKHRNGGADELNCDRTICVAARASFIFAPAPWTMQGNKKSVQT